MFTETSSGTISRGEVIVNEKEDAAQTNLILLNGNFSTSDGSYRLQIRSDGTGRILYSDFPEDFEEFEHEIEVERLARKIEAAIQVEITFQSQQETLTETEIEEIRSEKTSEVLTDVFWEQINQTLEDPFFCSMDDDFWGEEFQTKRGTVEELTAFLKLCLLTEKEIGETDEVLIVQAESEVDPAGLSDSSYYTERLSELVEIACGYYQPTGFSYNYNDSCYDRMSGYSMDSETVSVSLAEFIQVPARQRMLGMKELRKKLLKMEVPTEKIDRLTAF